MAPGDVAVKRPWRSPRGRLLIGALREIVAAGFGNPGLGRAVRALTADLEAASRKSDLPWRSWRRVNDELARLEREARGGPVLALIHEDMRVLEHGANQRRSSRRDL